MIGHEAYSAMNPPPPTFACIYCVPAFAKKRVNPITLTNM